MPAHNRSAMEGVLGSALAVARRAGLWIAGPGRHVAAAVALRLLYHVRRNLVARRVLSFPHLLVLFWGVILLWGERWVFESRVHDCDWRNWEKWPKGATPHHLIFVADPQIIDPHSYPGRPWPLSSLTVTITDNYMRRGYGALQRQLQPDSLFFLGDLFDGGREWKTRQGIFVDPKWGRQRSGTEKKWVKTWHRKYGEDFWMREYQRFGDIFFDSFNKAGGTAGPYQRGRKLVASLPGNHDLGFGAMVQVPVRDRFGAYFGEGNRVDIVGNHTIVSVDTVSLSADSDEQRNYHDLKPIYGPVNEFLDTVQATKRKRTLEELEVWYGANPDRDLRFRHKVEDLDTADLTRPVRDPGPGSPDFPTILLTHVPLYRPPGTPCGPQRERHPPTKPPKGQSGPVIPDHPNAISVVAGYQYQNVLSEDDSVKLIKKIGNVVHVFSGDDHDYCELVHSDAKENVREITVKSISMAMGISNPGFLMASLYNPVDSRGRPMVGSPERTMQTHLCLLPNQYHTYMKYVAFVILTLVLLAVRAALVPILRLTPFALEPEAGGGGGATLLLPVHKDKVEPPDSGAARYGPSGTSSNHVSARGSASARRLQNASISSLGSGGGSTNGGGGGSSTRWEPKRSKSGGGGGKWGWNDGGGPRIKIEDAFYVGGKAWKPPGRGGRFSVDLGGMGREMWTTTWRVVWMTMLFWIHLNRRG